MPTPPDLEATNNDAPFAQALLATGHGPEPLTFREAVLGSEVEQRLEAMQIEVDIFRSFPAWELQEIATSYKDISEIDTLRIFPAWELVPKPTGDCHLL